MLLVVMIRWESKIMKISKISKSVAILVLLTITSAYAEDLDLLLDKYKSESELSKKTKDENAGHVIVFTRDDLERMQVETLKDVLKSLRLFRYLENRVGEPDLLNIDPVLYSSKSIRIYLNDNELVIPITGSGFLMFGNIDMDFIDHVEVYEGFPSFEFGVEPAMAVIRLYSKVAERDSGTRLKVLGASRGSHKENIYTAGFDEELSYFVYANQSQNNQKKYEVAGQSVARDGTMKNFYGSLSKKNYKFELNAMQTKHDAFLGMIPDEVPHDTDMKRDFINASLSSKFQDNTLSCNLSYIHASGDYSADYDKPTLGNLKSTEQEYDSDVLTAIVQKKLQYKMHALSFGLQYRYKDFIFDDINGVPSNSKQKYDKESIYSIFIEDSILLQENSLIGISLMQQLYDRNKDMQDETVTQWRLSYIYSSQHFIAKTFLSHQEFIPEPFMTAGAHIGNPDLNPEKYLALSQEFSYKEKNTLSKLTFGYGNTKGFLVANFKKRGKVENSQDDLKLIFGAIEFSYFFRKKDKLELQADYEYLDVPGDRKSLNHFNYLVRMVNTVDKFDIFNELVINSGYENLDTGYDYSAGVKYRATADLHFALKGENIFDTGMTRKYYYHLLSQPKQLEVPVIEQKFMLSMEYLF